MVFMKFSNLPVWT